MVTHMFNTGWICALNAVVKWRGWTVKPLDGTTRHQIGSRWCNLLPPPPRPNDPPTWQLHCEPHHFLIIVVTINILMFELVANIWCCSKILSESRPLLTRRYGGVLSWVESISWFNCSGKWKTIKFGIGDNWGPKEGHVVLNSSETAAG